MDSPKLVVLDVGHGNAAVLHDSDGIIVCDAGLGGTLDDYLDSCKTPEKAIEVTALLISHSDADHLGGASNVLLSEDVNVRAVYLNPDSNKDTPKFKAFRHALADSIARSGTVVHTQLTTSTGTMINAGSVSVEVLAPGPSLAVAGSGGKDMKDRRIKANTMSAVIRLSHSGRHIALLPGDIDQVALEYLLSDNSDITAETLVFPHHGGHPGSGDPASFAEALVAAVRPHLVLFSTGRGAKHANPLPEIINGIRKAGSDAHIGCTQLSTRCSAIPPDPGMHLSALPAAGASHGSCCIGTVEIAMQSAPGYFPILDNHRTFVEKNVPGALCMANARAQAAGGTSN